GAGDDVIDFSGLSDTSVSVIAHGNDGNDVLVGPHVSKCDATTLVCAQLFGDAGDDTLADSSTQNDLLSGGDGNDTLYGRNSDYGSPNAATSISNNGVATLHGDGGDDTITGSPGVETIDGGQGDDTINGGGGADNILGVNSASVVHIVNTTTDGSLVL